MFVLQRTITTAHCVIWTSAVSRWTPSSAALADPHRYVSGFKGLVDSTGVLVGAVIALVTGIVAGVGTGLIFGIAVVGTGVRAERRHASLNFRNGSRAAVVLGVVIALTFGIVSWHFIGFTNALRIGLTAGVVGGLTAGLVAMVAGGDGHRPARGTRWNIRKASLTGLTVGLVIGVLSGLGQGLGRALTTGLASGVAFWVAAAIVVGLEGIPGELTTAVSPTAVLTRDRRTTLVLAVVAVVAAGIVTGVTAGLKYGLLSRGGLGLGLVFGLGLGLAVGLEAGLVLGLTISGFGSAWPHWVMARAWLALRRRLPWRLMAFLAQAHELGVLRQFGAVYQFRHIELQHRLARHPYTEERTPVSRGPD